nr:PAAR domain-containing protein [Vogesella sp. LIG4]
MRRYHITLGALTSVGGRVVSASHMMTIDGRNMALEGDKIACPACQGPGSIICTGPRHMETLNGRHVALEGDLCACACVPLPRLLANQDRRCQQLENAMTLRPTLPAARALIPAATGSPQFDERFKLVDAESGQPLVDLAYAIERESGEIEHGRTDADGCTHLLSATTMTEKISLYVEG